jgi:hypothetical protein
MVWLQSVYILCYAFVSMLCVWMIRFHVECMNFVRGEVCISIVSLPEKFLQRVQWKSTRSVLMKFWVSSHKISGGISLILIPEEVQIYHRAMKGMHRPV